MALKRHILHAPLFPEFPVSPITVVLDATELAVYSVRLELTGDQAMWEHIQQQGLFGYSADICGPIMGGKFLPDVPLQFTLSLVYDQLQLLSIMVADPAATAGFLAAAEPSSALRKTESYQLLSVMQQRTPKTQWGLTTTYFAAQLS